MTSRRSVAEFSVMIKTRGGGGLRAIAGIEATRLSAAIIRRKRAIFLPGRRLGSGCYRSPPVRLCIWLNDHPDFDTSLTNSCHHVRGVTEYTPMGLQGRLMPLTGLRRPKILRVMRLKFLSLSDLAIKKNHVHLYSPNEDAPLLIRNQTAVGSPYGKGEI